MAREPPCAGVTRTRLGVWSRYDPNVRIDDTIDSEEDRIEFLTSVAAVMASKARIKLNLKRLYAADGHAVKELLKIASILYKCAACWAARRRASR